jgi:hypothetical protein
VSGGLRILVSGMLAGDPGQGGATWAVLQYVLGFRRLGHAVHFVEQLPERRPASARYFEHVVDTFGLRSTAALLMGDEILGPPPQEVSDWARSADVLINISGLLQGELASHAPVRVYLDVDPAFTQLWQAVDGIDMRLEDHTHFVTLGQSIGREGCDIPTCDRDWLGMVHPVVLEEWPVGSPTNHDAFTSVGNWRGYGSIEHAGVQYGQRVHSFRDLIGLPGRTEAALLLALAIHPEESEDVEALAAHGWSLLDPAVVADTPNAYRQFIAGSRGELGVAKSGYVKSRCGWFSDRSCCYLASGRPVLAQETGFSAYLPVGEGLLAYSTIDEAAAGLDRICGDYTTHAAAARAIAEEHLDSDRVLTRMLELVHAA